MIRKYIDRLCLLAAPAITVCLTQMYGCRIGSELMGGQGFEKTNINSAEAVGLDSGCRRVDYDIDFDNYLWKRDLSWENRCCLFGSSPLAAADIGGLCDLVYRVAAGG